MIKVAICWSRELKGTETDIVQSLVVDAESLIRVLDQLMNREGCIVGLRDKRSDGCRRVRELSDKPQLQCQRP